MNEIKYISINNLDKRKKLTTRNLTHLHQHW